MCSCNLEPRLHMYRLIYPLNRMHICFVGAAIFARILSGIHSHHRVASTAVLDLKSRSSLERLLYGCSLILDKHGWTDHFLLKLSWDWNMVRLRADSLRTHVSVGLDGDRNDRVAQWKIHFAPLISSCRNLVRLQKCNAARIWCGRDGLQGLVDRLLLTI